MGTENFSLFEQWFRLADEDNDGKVAGAEAVKFFKRSELPQPVLAQVRPRSQAARQGVGQVATRPGDADKGGGSSQPVLVRCCWCCVRCGRWRRPARPR